MMPWLEESVTGAFQKEWASKGNKKHRFFPEVTRHEAGTGLADEDLAGKRGLISRVVEVSELHSRHCWVRPSPILFIDIIGLYPTRLFSSASLFLSLPLSSCQVLALPIGSSFFPSFPVRLSLYPPVPRSSCRFLYSPFSSCLLPSLPIPSRLFPLLPLSIIPGFPPSLRPFSTSASIPHNLHEMGWLALWQSMKSVVIECEEEPRLLGPYGTGVTRFTLT